VNSAVTMLLALVVPLAAAPLIVFVGRRPNLRESVTLIAATILFALVITLAPQIMDGARPSITLAEPLPGLPLALKLEPLGMLFALIASFLWLVTSVYSIGYMRGHNEQHQTGFYAYFAIALSAVMGVAFAGNMLTLFVFYEILTLSTYPLVTHSGTEQARQAGRLYLGLLLGTSFIFLLLAIVWTWSLAGTLDFRSGGILSGTAPSAALGLLLVLYVFGVGKAALMPFHRWLPAAMVAPTPVSALLHAVAVVKAGVFTVLKVSVYVFGSELMITLLASQWLQYLAGATILLASLIAMRQDNLKARLAYSTISQLGYVVLGAMLANASGIVGSAMHIATHAFGKITLFFCAGAIMVATHKTEVSQMGGLGRRMPLTMTAFLLASLSIIGLPPTGGTWSKWHLALGTLEAGQLVLLAVLMISTLLNIAYLLPIPIRAFFSPPPDVNASGDVAEAPLACLVAIIITTVGCLALFFYPELFYRLALQIGG
jgi:multicomponent Na+:H+ antiporter subunit D